MSGLALAASSIGCTAATDGLGDDIAIDSAESGDIGKEDGEEGDDADDADTSANEGNSEGQQDCVDPLSDAEIGIYLVGEAHAIESCEELRFSAKVAVANVGIYGLVACDCDAPDCTGEAFELNIDLPDTEWLPGLEAGSCHYFNIFAEEVEPGVCRRNRLDIAKAKGEAPWYSTGSASEDLDHNGLAITPVERNACSDACGEWQSRDIMFEAKDVAQTLSWGQVAPVGQYEVVHWRSFVTPGGCGGPSVDLTAWTAR